MLGEPDTSLDAPQGTPSLSSVLKTGVSTQPGPLHIVRVTTSATAQTTTRCAPLTAPLLVDMVSRPGHRPGMHATMH